MSLEFLSPRQLIRHVAQLARQSYRLGLRQVRIRSASRRNTVTQAGEIKEARRDLLRVLWVLGGNEWLGSARLKGVVIDQFFRRRPARVFSRIAYMPPEGNYLDPALNWRRSAWRKLLAQDVDILCFQTRTGATEALLNDCRAEGVATAFSISDLDIESVPKCVWEFSDAVVVSSAALAESVRKIHQRVVLIDDPIDVPDKSAIMPSSSSDRNLVLVWVGHQDRWQDVSFLRRVLDCGEFGSFRLSTISRHPETTHQWTPATAWADACRGDVAVVPAEMTERGKAKSSNRLACFMALGFPAIATPIPAYQAHIRHGENGFLATTVEEWRKCLGQLRDPVLRRRVGDNAKETASVKALRIPAVAARWQQLFESLAQDRRRSKLENRDLPG